MRWKLHLRLMSCWQGDNATEADFATALAAAEPAVAQLIAAQQKLGATAQVRPLLMLMCTSARTTDTLSQSSSGFSSRLWVLMGLLVRP